MRRGLLILNVYSSPRRYDERFYGLIGKAVKMATDAGIPLVVAGDFNAPHSTWGYVRDSISPYRTFISRYSRTVVR
ncbi:hypothetical protein HPB49_009971 [Dermacentor silvarum]|uniref:Uncharacterized protein n=1 Tax=Dermacentor silvarum TaxID=543639 RepID=A0ACB8DCA3_DERSI|nr:hypothetical protein HPB49_009971 [Dermacentor silvarum]